MHSDNLSPQALGKLYFMKYVVHSQCAWLTGFAAFAISDLNNSQLKEETISCFINQNQITLKVAVEKQWQESNACNLERKPRTVN